MATRYQDLVDIDGLNKAIKQAEANSGRFRNAATDDFKRINTYASTLRAELERINRTLVNGGKPIQIITQGEAQRVVDLSNQVSNLTTELNNQKSAIASLSSVMAANKAAVSDAKVQAANYTTELARLRTEAQSAKTQVQQTNAQIAQGKLSSQQAAQANQAHTATITANKAAQSAVALQTAQTTLQIKQLSLANRQAAQVQTAATGSYREAQNRLSQLGNQIRNVAGGFAASGPIQQARIAEYNRLNDALKKFDSSMGNHQRNVGNYVGSIKSVVGVLGGYYVALQGIIYSFNASLESYLKIDSIRASLTFTLGSAFATSAKFKELQVTADRLGLEFISLAESYSKFSAAALASNFSLELTDKIFNSVIGAGARLHLTADQVSGSLLAIQQMISKGTVSAEELRGQLGERLPGAFSIAARSIGVTEIQLGKMLKNGELLSKDLLPKLAVELDKTFKLDTETRIDSLNASLNRFKNLFTEGKANSNVFSDIFKTIIEGATTVTGSLLKITSSTGWNEFWARLSSNGTADTIRSLNMAFKAGNQAIPEVRGALLKDSTTPLYTDELKRLLGQVQAQRIETGKAYNQYAEAIRSGKLKDGGKNSLTDFKDQYDQLNAYETRIRQLFNERLPKDIKSGSKQVEDAQLTSIKEIRTRIAELSKLPGSAIDGSVINNRIDALKARLKELSPSTKAVKEGFAELEEKLRAVNTQVEIAVLRDYTNHQGKESASTRALAEQYSKLAQQLVKVKDAKDAAMDGVSRRQKIVTFGSVFPTLGGQAPSSIPIPDFSRDEALNASNDALGKLDEVALAYAKLNRDITDQYRKRQITKEQYDQQMVQSEEHQIIEEFTLNRTAIDKRLEYLQLSNKQNTKEYTQLLTQRATLDRTYNDKRIELELKAAERVKAIYADVFSTIQQSASTIGGATGGLIGNIGTILEKSLVNQKNGTSFSDSEKLQAGLSVAGSAVGIYTETAINASKLRMAQIEAEYQNELKLAGDNEEAKTKITNEYNRKAKEEQIKQARYQKAAAATEIIINTAIAVSKAIAQGGGLFGIPLAAIVGALGAVQLGLVLAQPLPQYAVGRNGGKEEYAMVNENGPELIGQGGAFRIANQGRKGITRLRSGDSVKTAATTQHMFASGAVARSAEMANNMGGAKAAYDTYVMTVAQSPGLSEDQTASAVSRGMNGLPLNNFSFDERGHNRYQSRVKDRQSFNRSRNKL